MDFPLIREGFRCPEAGASIPYIVPDIKDAMRSNQEKWFISRKDVKRYI